MFKKHLTSSAALALIFCAGIYAGAAWTEGDEGARPPQAAEPASSPDDPPPPQQADSSATAESEEPPPGRQRRRTPFGPILRKGLEEVEGCLKAESARTLSGKFVIFGWFEDKEAVKRWYYSDTHQQLLDRFYPTRNRDRVPLTYVPEDTKPIMAIASITMPDTEGETFPQISIELYTPLHGGFSGGGLFGPDEFKDQFMHYDQYFNPYGNPEPTPSTDPTSETAESDKGQSRR